MRLTTVLARQPLTTQGSVASPLLTVPADARSMTLTLSGVDLATMQDETTRFLIGFEETTDEGSTWTASAYCTIEGDASLTVVPPMFLHLSAAPGQTLRGFLETLRPLTFAIDVEAS